MLEVGLKFGLFLMFLSQLRVPKINVKMKFDPGAKLCVSVRLGLISCC